MEAQDAPPQDACKRARGRPRRDAETIPRILAAAERLLAGKGIAGVGIRDIAARVSQ